MPTDPQDPPDEITERLRVPLASSSSPAAATGPLVNANVNLTLGTVALKTKVPVPAGPTALRQLLPILNAFSQAIVHAAVERSYTSGETVSCKNHCAACCRQLVPITPPEAHRLATLVANLPEPRRAEIHARFAAAQQKITEAHLLDPLTHFATLPSEEADALSISYFHQQIPCPFLQDESCSIYHDRPFICREYLVTSDPAHCATLSSDIKGIKLPGSLARAVALSTDTPHNQRPAPRRIPLPLALDWAAAHPETPPTTTGPELLSQVLGHLSSPFPQP